MSIYDNETREYARDLEHDADKSLKIREHTTNNCDKEDTDGARTPYMRDYARILYSSSFRRLQGKMQLLGLDPTLFHRNRLTHSLEVAQIAKTIANGLGVDPVVAESCSLAHDIGHPPFGHHGETILNKLGDDIGGFEGNAQTFRILRHLEKKSPGYCGLDLTLRTLFGSAKYVQKKSSSNKKFLYDNDYKFLQEHLNNMERRRSIDVQIMDLSDEIAYAAHDLEDVLSFNIVTLDEIEHGFYSNEDYKVACCIFNNMVNKSRDKTRKEVSKNAPNEEYTVVLRKKITSKIVDTLCRNIGLVDNELGYKSEEFKALSKGLKKLVYDAIMNKPTTQLYEKKGAKVIKGLYQVYMDESYNKDFMLLPPEYRSSKTCKDRKRGILDYISGMMDSFAIQEFVRYFGASEYERAYGEVRP